VRTPGLEEVASDPDEAPPVVEEPPLDRADGAEGRPEEQRGPGGDGRAQDPRRTHLRVVALRQRRAELDAGERSGARHPGADLAIGEAREEPNLLVRETSVTRLAEGRDLPDPPLERGALLDRPGPEPDPLLAVVGEGRETCGLPDAGSQDGVRAEAEDAVPAGAPARELPQCRVDLLRRREFVEAQLRRADVQRAREIRPALGLLLEPRLQRVAARGRRPERAPRAAGAVVPRLDGVLRDVLLRHRLEPLGP